MTENDGTIDYNDILDALNWRQLPVAKPVPTSEHEASDFASTRHTDDARILDQTTHERKKFNVQYSVMLNDLGLSNSYTTSALGSCENCDECRK